MKIDVNEALNQIAKGFNVAVEELYPILYKQAIISGIFSLMWSLIFVAVVGVFIFLIRLIIKKQKEEEEKSSYYWDWDEPRQITILIVGSIASIIGFFVIPIGIEEATTAFFNTDYYVLKDILNRLK